MKQTKSRDNSNSVSYTYHPHRWTLVVPMIKKEYTENGIRYYKTDNGKIYDANVYDQKLVPHFSKKRN